MPRQARQKHSEAIYHIMSRSVSEIMLFRDDDDKRYYLKLLKKYIDTYKCCVYAYCLMSTHVHLHIDPKGYDISKLMHGLNTAYVLYYNKKYKRHGHVMQERFQSRIVDSERYNLAVSAYIHNNPKDIEGYTGREAEYEFSSYGIYLGLRKDRLNLVDKSFICNLMDEHYGKEFVKKYFAFVGSVKGKEEIQGIPASLPINRYDSASAIDTAKERKVITRGKPVAAVLAYLSEKLNVPVPVKYIASYRNRKDSEHKAFTAYVLRVLCSLGYRQICDAVSSGTVSGCSKLCNKGFELTKRSEQDYGRIFKDLLDFNAC